MAKKRSRSPKPRRHSRSNRSLRPARRPKPPREAEASYESESSPSTAADLEPDASVPVVVGVGASAGGLEAFSDLLDALPQDSTCAFVLVQHLSPQHESALPMLLAAHTTLPVVQVADGMSIEPQHVYVIPPNTQMAVKDGRFQLVPRPHDRTQFTPVDVFFQSLARWAGARAIGVILSGTASDGAVGIREIKGAGGITIAQRPGTAKHDGMPNAAIATGMIDLVLSPREIAGQLADIHRHPYLEAVKSHGPEGDVAPAEAQLREVFTLLRRVSGVDFTRYKMPTVRRRLLRRMALHRLADIGSYVRYLREHTQEATALYRDLLINVTSFFREPASFAALAADVFPEISSNRETDDPIRIWVPGCATGEEAYSVAIALLEWLRDGAAERRMQIFATDVSDTAVERARAGVYPLSIAADVSADRLKRFFVRSDGGYRVSKLLRDVCVFARHDLTRDPPFSRLDLILCRNVLIYLDIPTQKQAVSVFHYALRPNRFLMLGPAETVGFEHLFTAVDKKWRLYRKAPVNVRLQAGFGMDAVGQAAATTSPVREAPSSDPKAVQDEANRVLLQKYSPAGVIVDRNMQVVQFRGQTGPFLEPPAGEPSLDLLKMAREGLLFPLRTALHMARRRKRAVRRDDVLVSRNGQWHTVSLVVMPLTGSSSGHFLVLFEPAGRAPAPKGRARKGGARAAGISRREADARAATLTRELAATRQHLHAVIQDLEAANEELQSANEEILSSNEELQSTNEELNTAREELQSTNEELNTLNEELHSRNEELTRVNGDLVNVLASVDIPIVIVGDDLRIKRFTPMAERLFNLIPGDVGRRLNQINPNLECGDLERLVRQTTQSLVARDHEVRDHEGRWYSLHVRPYKGVDNRIDGAVLAVVDIDVAKRYQQQTERARDYFVAIVETVREPLVVLDEELRVKTANRAFYGAFKASPAETEGRHVYELGSGQWNVPALRTLLQQVQSTDATVEDFGIEHEFPGVGRKRVVVNARRLALEDSTHWILLAIEDRTDAS